MTWGQLRDQCSRQGFGKEESKAALKTRLTAMGAAEATRNLREVTQEDGKRGRAPGSEGKISYIPPGVLGPHSLGGIRERAPAEGAKDSDNPTQTLDLNGERERASAKGVKDSDILTQLLDSTHGGGDKDALGSGKGEREQAPTKGATVSDNPYAFWGEDAMDTSETLTGKRGRAPAEGGDGLGYTR